MAITAIAELLIKPGQLSRFLQICETVSEGSNAEPGVLEFRFFQDKRQPCKFFILERYVDKAAVATHKRMPHTLAFFEQQEALVESASMNVVLDEGQFSAEEH